MAYCSELSRQPVSLDKEEVRIVLLGSNADVKASCGNTILAQKVFSEPLSPWNLFERHDGIALERRVVMINTPDLLDLILSPEEQDMRRFFYLAYPGPHALLLVLKPGTFTGLERGVLKLINNIFGAGASEYVIVIFMHEEEMEDVSTEDSDNVSKAVESLQNAFRQPHHHLQRNEDQSQVQKLLESIEKMVEENGGHHLKISDDSRPAEKKETITGRSNTLPLEIKGRGSKKFDHPNMCDLRIVLLGKNDSVNHKVRNLILGINVSDSEELAPLLKQKVLFSRTVKGRHVSVINSPQLLQTNISDHQITQTVRECVYLSDPGPHVIVLLLKHEQCSAEDQECVEKVLHSFSERVYQHTVVLTTQESTETNDILQKIIQKCFNRHFSLQRSSSPDDLLQVFEDIVKMNDGRHLVCAEGSEYFTMKQHATERKGVKLNLVVCGSDGALKSSISELILQQTDRRSDVELHGRQISLVELPALFNTRLSEEEVTRQTLRCVSLCDPGVHVFLLILPDAPLNNEDKAEMEEIQRIFSSRINKHMMILIMQNSEHQTEELNEETQSVIERFGGRHHFFGPNSQVSTLMENIEKMLEENRGEFFSTETFLEAQMKKLLKFEEMKKKIHSLETYLLSQGSRENSDEVRIVLLGKTGVGKSASGNTILGRYAFTAETSHRSVTKESQRETSEINGRHVTVIDTPGLFDTELTNEEIHREISNCISMILLLPYNPSRSLRSHNSGLLVVPRIAKSTKGGRAFSHLAPELLNSLPDNVRGSDSLTQFKSRLKAHLFSQAFT